MPKKPPRDNPRSRELRTVHNAGQAAAGLLQRITRKAGVVLSDPGDGQSWLEKLRAALPEEQRRHLVDVIEKAEELVLLVDAAVWAGRIRLSLPDLAPLAAPRQMKVRISGGK
jgi:hypothetical protein